MYKCVLRSKFFTYSNGSFLNAVAAISIFVLSDKTVSAHIVLLYRKHIIFNTSFKEIIHTNNFNLPRSN